MIRLIEWVFAGMIVLLLFFFLLLASCGYTIPHDPGQQCSDTDCETNSN